VALGRSLAKLGALAGGLAAGLAVVVAVAMYGDAVRPSAPDGGPIQQSAVALATRTPTPMAMPVPEAIRVNSLAEMASRAPPLRGQLVRVVVGEQELTDLTAGYLRSQGIPASDVRVRLRPGRMVLTGNLQQGILSLGFTVDGHPTVVDRSLKLTVDSVEPSLVSQLSPVAPGQTIDLPMSFEARSVDVVEGQMIVTGVAR